MPTSKIPQTKKDFVQSQAIRATQTLLVTHGLSLTMDQIADAARLSAAIIRTVIEASLSAVEAQVPLGPRWTRGPDVEEVINEYQHAT